MLGFAAIALISLVLIVSPSSEAEEVEDLPLDAIEVTENVVDDGAQEETGGFRAWISAKAAPYFDDDAKQKAEELDDREHTVLAREVEISEVKLALIEQQLAHETRVNSLMSCVAAYVGGDQ